MELWETRKMTKNTGKEGCWFKNKTACSLGLFYKQTNYKRKKSFKSLPLKNARQWRRTSTKKPAGETLCAKNKAVVKENINLITSLLTVKKIREKINWRGNLFIALWATGEKKKEKYISRLLFADWDGPCTFWWKHHKLVQQTLNARAHAFLSQFLGMTVWVWQEANNKILFSILFAHNTSTHSVIKSAYKNFREKNSAKEKIRGNERMQCLEE